MVKLHWRNDDFFTKGNLVCAYIHENWDNATPLHSHEFYELNIVLNGSGKHYIGERCVRTTPGDTYVIPPGITHNYAPDTALDIYHILIQPDFLTRYGDDLNAVPGFKTLFEIEPALRGATDESYFLHLNSSALAEATVAADKIVEAQKRALFALQNVITLHFVCSLCMKMHEKTAETDTETKIGADLAVLQSLEYIQTHLEDKIKISRLAAHAAMSEATYNRHFKKLLRLTPAEYILQCRIKKSKRLLAEKKHTKTEIAQMCGFFDVSHMNKYLG